RSQLKSCPWTRPAVIELGILTASRFNVQFVSFASGATSAGAGGAWLVLFVAGVCSSLDAPATWLVPVSADLNILPRNANTPAPAAQINQTSTNTAMGRSFTGAVGLVSAIFGTGRSPTLVPVMMYFGLLVAGACGTVILWKHVGHSIIVLIRHDSHLICCPH